MQKLMSEALHITDRPNQDSQQLPKLRRIAVTCAVLVQIHNQIAENHISKHCFGIHWPLAHCAAKTFQLSIPIQKTQEQIEFLAFG
jgi:hypothetical protein